MYPNFENILPYQELSIEQRKSLHRRTLGFVFRLMSYKQYTDYLKTLGCAPATETRAWIKANLLHNGYVMHDIKHWLYSVACGIDNGSEKAIHSYDLKLATLLDRELLQGLRRYAPKFLCLDPEQTQALLAAVWNRNRDHVMRFCWVKLRFVAQQRGDDLEDVANELMVEGLRALRHAWPCYPSELYCDNLFKRTVHNCGINLIEKMTTQKHARLVADGQGYRSLNLQLDVAMINQETAGDSNMIVGMGGCKVEQEILDLRITLAQIDTTLTPNQRRLMMALQGHVPEFSVWLQENSYVAEHEDNEQLRERTSLERYLKLASDWLSVEYAKVWRFVQNLKTTLGDYRHAC